MILSKQADQEYQSSLLVKDHILEQDDVYGYELIAQQLDSKATVKKKTTRTTQMLLAIYYEPCLTVCRGQ